MVTFGDACQHFRPNTLASYLLCLLVMGSNWHYSEHVTKKKKKGKKNPHTQKRTEKKKKRTKRGGGHVLAFVRLQTYLFPNYLKQSW